MNSTVRTKPRWIQYALNLFAYAARVPLLFHVVVRGLLRNLFNTGGLSPGQYIKNILGLNPEYVLLDRIFRMLEREAPHLAESYVRFASLIFPWSLHLRLHAASSLYRRKHFKESWRKYESVFKSIEKLKGPIKDGWLDQYFALLHQFYAGPQIEDRARAILVQLKTFTDYKLFFFMFARHGSTEMIRRLLATAKTSVPNGERAILDVFDSVTLAAPELAAQIDVLLPESKLKYVEPRVFESHQPRPVREIPAPSIWIATIADVQIIGAYGILKNDKLVCYEPAADPRLGFVAGSWRYITGINSDEKRVVVGYEYSEIRTIPEAILIGGRCSTNYFHWLVEYLPKFWSVDQKLSLKNVPVLIDKGLYPQQVEALKILLKGRPVIEFDQKALLKVAKLHIPSLPTYMPDRFDVPFWQNSALVRAPLEYLRAEVLRELKVSCSEESPKKIYLSRRTTSGRKMGNELEIEETFRSFGFEIVIPEQLSFEQQVRLFHGADVIAAAAGASISNALFCNRGATILALTSERNNTFGMHANVAEIGGAEFLFVSGENVRPREEFGSEAEFVHSGYIIDQNKLIRAIHSVLNSRDNVKRDAQHAAP